ncbi:hypothetical protein R3O04_019345 [Bacteroides hominis]|uniref:hypothetical protein n=1 Tax=Bacteroides hominis TaxID=2763023 RepID=UPI003D6C7C25
MVTFLIVLMMMCNLWILFYLTWEQQERQKAGSQENTDRKRQETAARCRGQEQVQNIGLDYARKGHHSAGSCHFRGSRGSGRKGRYLCR